ncbi:MAG: branched-chain amino acid ABC transporter permease [Hyphomicrobiaceae bacterium]
MRTPLFNWPTLLFLAVAIVALPFLQRPVVAAEILTLGLAAVALNLLVGYTGMLSFGHAMFFGIAAYATGILVAKLGWSGFIAIPVAVLVNGVIAWLVGLICVRRTGLYFIMITFAFNQMFYFIAYSWTTMTGGEDGLPDIKRPLLVEPQWAYYAFVALVFLVSLVILKKVVDSPTGRILQAIRDNPERAAATGHDVSRYKLIAFVISGTFTGVAGSLYAFAHQIMPVDRIHWLFSGDLVFMTLLGGSGSFIGPVIGAAFYTWLQDTVSLFWPRWPLVLGVVFALVVLFFRGGVAGLVETVYRKLFDKASAKQVATTT